MPVAACAARASGRQAGPPTKLASLVADRIVADIGAAGWPTGEVLGSESDLLERYGVSRAVFREAVRLLEHRGVARTRRGPGGGLVVAEPSLGSAIDAVMVYLLFIRAELGEVFEARLALEESAARLASERLTEDGRTRLRDLAAREAAGGQTAQWELHALLASITANPALELFVEVLNRVTTLYTPEEAAVSWEVRGASSEAHARIVDSVIAGDGDRAARRMRRHLEAWAGFMAERLPAEPRLDDVFVPDGGAKLAETVARQLFADVTASGWNVGELLGSEPDLMHRFDISRAALREAVRLLEHHRIARMRRGPGGGLFVAEPGIDATTAALALHLDRRRIEAVHLFEVRNIVEMTVLDRVIDGLDDAGVAALRRALEVEAAASSEELPVIGHDFHTVLADVAGNRVLALLADVLVHLSRSRVAVPEPPEEVPTGAVTRAHRGIVDAIAARDLDLARQRMRSHLDALVRWVR